MKTTECVGVWDKKIIAKKVGGGGSNVGYGLGGEELWD